MASDNKTSVRLYELQDGEVLTSVLREKHLNTPELDQRFSLDCISVITVNDFKVKLDDLCDRMINSEKTPSTILISFTVKNYWRAIKIDIDYNNRKAFLVFDDPCGPFPKPFLEAHNGQESLVSVIKSNVEKLIRKQQINDSFSLLVDQLDKVILDVTGKNLNKIRSDSGPVTFSHLDDYLNGFGTDGQYAFTIPGHNKQGYNEAVENVRLEHLNYIDRKVEIKPKVKTKKKVLDPEICLKKLKLDQATLAATRELIIEITGNQNLNDKDFLEKCRKIGENLHNVNWNQDDPDCIRNKHGYRNRFIDKGNQLNKSGAQIDFETLGYLKDLAQDDDCKWLLTSHRDLVNKSLNILKQKIDFIQTGKNKIPVEESKIDNQADNSSSKSNGTDYLICACAYSHDFICINRTIELLDVYLSKQTDMKKKPDRYYVGYIMSQVGELAKEISENLKKEAPMLLFFRNIGCFRQQLKNHSSWLPNGTGGFSEMKKSLDECSQAVMELYKEIKSEIFPAMMDEKVIIEKIS